MYNNIINYETVKQIWGKIEIFREVIEEVRASQWHILVFQYEGFMTIQKESIVDVFERVNKLINDLQLHDEYYETHEMNLKFLLINTPRLFETKDLSNKRKKRSYSNDTGSAIWNVENLWVWDAIKDILNTWVAQKPKMNEEHIDLKFKSKES